MEKCWFVLRQTHYPPPEDGVGPIQLGHLIPGLRKLDQVINSKPGPYPYPRGIAVYKSRQETLSWQLDYGNGDEISNKVLVPLPHTAGLVSAGGKFGYAFQRSVIRYWEFDALDVNFIQPTRAYIEETLDEEAVRNFIDRNQRLNSWSLFMVSGLSIARGAKGQHGEKGKNHFSIGPSSSIGNMVNADIGFSVNRDDQMAASFERSSDFIWAVQLTKISKSFCSDHWKYETYAKGATYALDDEMEDDVEDLLSEQGIDSGQIMKAGENLFVFPDTQTD